MPSNNRADSEDISEEPPTSINPYEVLGLSDQASEEEIRKAYRTAALKHHPDKATDIDPQDAKEKFQEIAFAYAILNDPRRRTRYDATGSTSESLLDSDEDFDWLDFYRAQYGNVVTDDKIDDFKKVYQGSDEERSDVLDAYTKHEGRMGKIYSVIMMSNVLDDDERFRSIIDEAIQATRVKAFDAYVHESEKSKQARIKNAKREADEAKKHAPKLETIHRQTRKAKGGDLASLIQQKQKDRGKAFLDNLEAKYVGIEKPKNGKKRGKAAEMDGPSEEMFEAMGKRKKK